MPLLLETRDVGQVTIVQCKGRIVVGTDSELFLGHVAFLLRDRRAIILQLGEVGFIDSSGLGAMVRALASVRHKGGDLKLCNIPAHTRNVLEMTNLIKLFDAHDSEESAVLAFYQLQLRAEQPRRRGPSVLCVDRNLDVLAYLRELLCRAGYEVQTINNLHDCLILLKATRFQLLLLGPELAASPATQQALQQACAKLRVVHLGSEFSGLDAGQAASALLEKVAACLNLGSSLPS
jgi:anti-sigma B factor antagonist